MTYLVLSDVQGWALLLLLSTITTLTDTDNASSSNNTTPTAPVVIDATLSSIILEHDVEHMFTLEKFEVTIMIRGLSVVPITLTVLTLTLYEVVVSKSLMV